MPVWVESLERVMRVEHGQLGAVDQLSAVNSAVSTIGNG
jgi:hypothetical protein